MCQNSLLAAPVYKSNKHQLAWQNEGTKYPRRRRNQVAISFHKELIGILMACSKKAVVVFLAVPLLMALLAATVSADLCGQVPYCEVNQCGRRASSRATKVGHASSSEGLRAVAAQDHLLPPSVSTSFLIDISVASVGCLAHDIEDLSFLFFCAIISRNQNGVTIQLDHTNKKIPQFIAIL